jgi:hypothetical protein
MKTIQTLKYLIFFYLGSMVFLLLLVVTIPLAIQHGVALTRTLIIEEDILEAALIVILFGVSLFILRTFKHTLYAHERAVNRAGEEKSKLISQIKEAFNYIGVVNVELHEIELIFCELKHYPQTKIELKLFIENLASKAMTVARVPWIAFRIISRCDGQTLKEYTIARSKNAMPLITMGNKAILENRHLPGLMKISSCQQNLDLVTVAILPTFHISEEENILITAIINQIEVHFMLYHSGFLKKHFLKVDANKTLLFETDQEENDDAKGTHFTDR